MAHCHRWVCSGRALPTGSHCSFRSGRRAALGAAAAAAAGVDVGVGAGADAGAADADDDDGDGDDVGHCWPTACCA